MVEEGEDFGVLIPNEVLFFILVILGVNRGDNEFDTNGVGCLLKFVLLEEELVVILDSDDLLRIGLLFYVREGLVWFGDGRAYQSIVLGNQAYFG